MFRLFRLKTPAEKIKVALRHSVRGRSPTKTANLEQAIQIAERDILFDSVDPEHIRSAITELNRYPEPYATYELAILASLHILTDPDLRQDLTDVQLAARVEMYHWARNGKITPQIAQLFDKAISSRRSSTILLDFLHCKYP